MSKSRWSLVRRAVAAAVGLLMIAAPLTTPTSVDAAPRSADLVWSTRSTWTAAKRASSSARLVATPDAEAQVVWGACGIFTDNYKVVRSFPRKRIRAAIGGKLKGGISVLRCGGPKINPSWGYRHILKDHGDQWRQRAALTNQNWRDVADFGIKWALKDPARVSYRSSNNTFCFSRRLYLYNKTTGERVGHMTPRVIVAGVSKNIITAFPPTSSYCPKSR